MPTEAESLLKFKEPLFVGEEGAPQKTAKKSSDLKTAKEKKAEAQLEDILNSILPPRTWKEEDSGNWMQYTSSTPATRMDVITLQEEMDAELIKRQAREAGICPVREDIYSQCFDELIRQITINGPERGLILLRVRDEIRMALDAYKILYDSSVTFGVRKQLQAEEGMDELEEKIAKLEKKKEDNDNKVLELTNKIEVFEKRAAERRSVVEKKRKEELDFLKYQGQHFDAFLKSASGGK